jgi:hypothetical protein
MNFWSLKSRPETDDGVLVFGKPALPPMTALPKSAAGLPKAPKPSPKFPPDPVPEAGVYEID